MTSQLNGERRVYDDDDDDNDNSTTTAVVVGGRQTGQDVTTMLVRHVESVSRSSDPLPVEILDKTSPCRLLMSLFFYLHFPRLTLQKRRSDETQPIPNPIDPPPSLHHLPRSHLPSGVFSGLDICTKDVLHMTNAL